MTTLTTAANFAKDEIYKALSDSDSEIVTFWEVQEVTKKEVTIMCLETNEIKTVKIYKDYRSNEYCFPNAEKTTALKIKATEISF
jgi:hypothetical protein